MFNKDSNHTVSGRQYRYLPRSDRMRTMLRLARTFLAGALTCVCCSVQAQGSSMTEYQVKAAYLFNFVAFTKWPGDPPPTLRLCIYGPDPFGMDIDKFQGEKVNGRLIEIMRISTVDQLGGCAIVFISSDVISNMRRVLDRTDNKPVLTVADSPGAAAGGVSLNMNMAENKVTFEVNLTAVRASNLRISFQLLRLAEKVHR
jgi:hypothetical protein